MADSSRRSTRFSARSKLLGQLLLENGDVKAEQIAQALKTQEQRGGLVGQILQEMEACSPQAIAAALLKQVQVTDVRCEELQVLPEVAALVPRELCDVERLCPFERLGNLLCLAMGNPLNRKAILQIEERTRLKVKSFKAPWPRIQELLQRSYGDSELVLSEPGGGPALPAELEADAGGVPASDEFAAPPVLDEPQAGGEAPPAEALPEEAPPLAEPAFEEAASAAAASPDEGTELPEQAEDSQQAASLEEQPSPGILPVTAELLSGSGARRVRQPEPPPPPKIVGLDQLDDSHAEIIETTARGLSRRGTKVETSAQEPARPAARQEARVNIDLDKLDFSGAETVAVEGRGEEVMEEVLPAAAAPPARASLLGLAQLKTVSDSYFFEEGVAPVGGRPDLLLDLIGGLPIAQTVAQSIGEYEAQIAAQAGASAPAPKLAARADRPVEQQTAPVAPVAAVQLGEADFNQAAAALTEDPVGEWHWQCISPGPLDAVAYEEN